MFERFTDRAKKVIALANQEAHFFSHEYVGTEHILLGLAKEGAGIGANVLKRLDIDFRKVRLEVEKRIKAGPETVTMGRLPQTPRAKKVFEYAIEEARSLNHRYVGTEHLLLGLCRGVDSSAAQVLASLNASFAVVREQVASLLGEERESCGVVDGIVAPFSFLFKKHENKFELLDADGAVVDSYEFPGLVGAYMFNALNKHQKSQKLLRELGGFLTTLEGLPVVPGIKIREGFSRRIEMVLDS